VKTIVLIFWCCLCDVS